LWKTYAPSHRPNRVSFVATNTTRRGAWSRVSAFLDRGPSHHDPGRHNHNLGRAEYRERLFEKNLLNFCYQPAAPS
jgi:hypothetical protein